MLDTVYINTIEDLKNLFFDNVIRVNKWSSSTKKLDNDIQSAGYNIDLKFFNEYKLPEDKEKLMITSNEWLLVYDLENQLEDMENYLNKNIQLSNDVLNQVKENQHIMVQQIKNLVTYIKHNNPELINILTKDIISQIHFIRGAIYGYPAENIEFWIKNYPNNKALDEALSEKQIIKKQFGIDIGLIRLTKKQVSSLINALSKAKKTIEDNIQKISESKKLQNFHNNLNEYMSWRQLRGMED